MWSALSTLQASIRVGQMLGALAAFDPRSVAALREESESGCDNADGLL